MGDEQLHLSQIETRWSIVFQAHQGHDDEALEAQRVMMERYGRAVHHYLLRVTRDPNSAADLAQEFALRFLRGDFRRANPGRGRFRDFVKTSVLHLVVDAHRRERSQAKIVPAPTYEPAAPSTDLADLDREFFDCWRNELMEQAWEALAKHERGSGQPFHTVLRLRVDRPELRSADLAELLSERFGRKLRAGWVRQTLLRAREKYVELLVAEVARSIGNPSAELVDEELMNLDLWNYCRALRDQSGGKTGDRG